MRIIGVCEVGWILNYPINPTSPKGAKAWVEGPLRPKEIPKHRDTLGQIRASTTRPAKVLPRSWRGPVRNQSVAKMIWTWAGSSQPKPDEVKMVLYIVEECGMPCFSTVTEGDMSIRTAEVRPYYNFFLALVEARA